MAGKLKLTRMGSKKRPFYRIVAAPAKSRRDGKPLEFLGYYDPMKNPAEIRLDVEKIKSWIAKGAQPTDTINSLLKKHCDLKSA